MVIKQNLSKWMGKKIIEVFGMKTAYYIKLYGVDYFPMRNALREPQNLSQKQFPTKVAIIGVMTDKYVKYFPRYYETIKKYFLPNTKKDFYCFTDQLDWNYFQNKDDVNLVPTEHRPMPYTMALTFNHMDRIKEKLKNYSHVIYVDTDMFFTVPVLERDFFTSRKPLFGVNHHAFVNKLGEFDFDSDSLASVKEGEDTSTYYQASFYGGESEAMLKMVGEIARRTNIDIKNNAFPRWLDESHLNKYLIENKHLVHTLPPSYSYPSLKPIPKPFKKKIVHITKRSYEDIVW